MAPDVRAVSSQYGGFWNFELQDFCYMTNRYFPPDEFFESLSSSLRTLVTSYPSTNRSVSSLLAPHLGMTPDELVVGNGASELISAITSLRVEHLAIPIPAFDEYLNRAETQGKRVSPYPMGPDFELDVDGFIAHVKEAGANSVVIVRPNNPAGTLVSKEDVVRMLRAFGGLDLVLVDESFLYFAGGDYRDLSVAGSIQDFPNLVVVNSMSKAYGVPGLRLGYAASGDAKLIARLRAELPIWSVNSLAQFFLEHLGEYGSRFADSCAQVRRATQALYRGLRGVPFIEPYPTHGNYVLCRSTSDLTGSEITARLFDEFRVLVNDCSGKRGLDARFFRIASRTTEENEELVRALLAITSETTAPAGARK
ncbi:MAG: histidinol-phosphate aminotransferase family protein [Chloroflexi bacterium]|nr:histidinol-phosphate aminotransferase family protein [Chloroflexota bacterium]